MPHTEGGRMEGQAGRGQQKAGKRGAGNDEEQGGGPLVVKNLGQQWAKVVGAVASVD